MAHQGKYAQRRSRPVHRVFNAPSMARVIKAMELQADPERRPAAPMPTAREKRS